MAFSLRYAELVRRLLLAAGTNGIGQRDLHQRSRTPKYNIDDLLMLLHAWQRRNWVDHYKIGAKHYWRATQLLHDQWFIVTSVVSDVLTADLPPSALSPSQNQTDDPEA